MYRVPSLPLGLLTVLISSSTFSAVAGSSLTFVDGGAGEDNYTAPALTRGASDQVLGRVLLNAGVPNAFTNVDISLGGTRSGLSNLKFWISSDATFGGDAQFGSTVATDPGAGTLNFNGTGNYPAGNTYLFLTGDISPSATGSTLADVTSFSAVEINSSTFNSGGPNPMSNANVALPVALSTFVIE